MPHVQIATTSLKRGSLYAAFGDKQAMFLKAYDRYSATMGESLLGMLDQPDVHQSVASLYRCVLDNLADTSHPPGCLIANRMAEAAGRGDAIEAVVRRSSDHAEQAFYERFMKAQADGQIPPGKDVRALARFFAATMRTLAWCIA